MQFRAHLLYLITAWPSRRHKMSWIIQSWIICGTHSSTQLIKWHYYKLMHRLQCFILFFFLFLFAPFFLPIVEPFFPFIRFNAQHIFLSQIKSYFLHHFVLISFHFVLRWAWWVSERDTARAHAPPRKHYSTIDRANDFFFLQQ